jgi:predicted acylesterase/phospholipase RssA
MSTPLASAFGRRAALGLGFVATACAPLDRGPSVPRGQLSAARVLGIRHERFLLDGPGIVEMDQAFHEAEARARQAVAAGRRAPAARGKLLAVSGGGENGAFGAGLLTGWTARGDRPEFHLVTGVSTGALTAPFAFLGPEWDGPLRSVCTDITLRDVAIQRSIFAAITNDAMADSSPLFHTIARHLDERMVQALAAGYRDGRLLLVGTTNLDAQLPVVWNIGAIADSRHPQALELIRRLLLASAAIPGAFPPVMIDVQANGERYQEMHVDGGAVAQAFLYPAALGAGRRAALRAGRRVLPTDAYVIRNGVLHGEASRTQRRTVNIAGRAVATMLTSSGINDVSRMYLNARRDGIGFHLAFIGDDFTVPCERPFDQGDMRALYEHAREKTLAGTIWHRRPPWDVEEPAPEAPRRRVRA